MTVDRMLGSLLAVLFALVLPSSWMGCSKSGLSTKQDAAASGGSGGWGGGGTGYTTNSSGTVGSGGTTPLGGVSGTGGVTESGGRAGTGGNTPGATGGRAGGGGSTKATGGATSDGGTMPAGGTTGGGGATGNGGGSGIDGGGAGGTGGSTGGGGGTGGSTGGAGGICAPPTVNLTGADAVANGPLITFNDNGAWSWFQDERAVVDVKGDKLVVGSVAFGGSRSGNIEAVIYDLATGKAGAPAKLGVLSVDDHNAPSLIVRPDGKYVAMWAGHNENCNNYFSLYDGTRWSEQKAYDWTPQGCPWSRTISYANLWFLGTDLVSFVRSVDTSPNYLISKDNGESWGYGGRLTATPTVGYVAGYHKYWGNNTDRIDFVGTEAHPRDNDNSLYHGYIKDGQIYNSTGKVIDATLADEKAQEIIGFTQVFKTRDKVGAVAISNAWVSDLVRYQDGTLGLIWTGRVGSTSNTASETDLRLLYGRFDGTSWKLTYLVKAGPKLYGDEQDYTGLGALVPDDPTTIYISTPYDPSTDTLKTGAKREIWRGTTCDNGVTFRWTPVTANSTKDNLRPIVPKWDAQHTALLWMKSSSFSASSITSSIVGTIAGP